MLGVNTFILRIPSILEVLLYNEFSLGANFPEFPGWTHNLGKFILGCCIKFDWGLLMELGTTVIKLYSGMLRLWFVGRTWCEINTLR